MTDFTISDDPGFCNARKRRGTRAWCAKDAGHHGPHRFRRFPPEEEETYRCPARWQGKRCVLDAPHKGQRHAFPVWYISSERLMDDVPPEDLKAMRRKREREVD